MTETVEAKITTWVVRDCMTDLGFGGAVGGIQLLSKDVSIGKMELVKEYPVPEGSDAIGLARALFLDAQEDADGLGNGTHHYVLYAYRNGQKQHFAKKTFLVVVEGQDNPLSEEEQTAKGLLGQTQRHLEATQRINAQSLPSLIHGYHGLISELSAHLRHHQSNQLETMTLMKELMMAKEQSELNMAAQVQRELRINGILEKVAEFVPVILPKLLPALMEGMNTVQTEKPKAEQAMQGTATVLPNGTDVNPS